VNGGREERKKERKKENIERSKVADLDDEHEAVFQCDTAEIL
jgi:hypothetical protein